MKDCMFIIFIHENSEGCSIMNFDSNWAYSRARGRLIIGVVGHPHHSPLLALHSNLNPNEFPCLMPNSPSHHHAKSLMGLNMHQDVAKPTNYLEWRSAISFVRLIST